MSAFDYLNDRKEKVTLPKEFLNIIPPKFEEFVKQFTLNPIFKTQIVLIEESQEEIEFTFSLNKSENKYLNCDGDDYLMVNTAEEILNNYQNEQIWNQNKIILLGGTYISQIYIGNGETNQDFVYIDKNYEDNFLKIADSIFDFFENLSIIFNPIVNNKELEPEKLKRMKSDYWIYKT